MKRDICLQVAKVFRGITRWVLLVLTVLLLIFALLSGAEGYGGGLKGIIQNSPNALPWLLLIIINIIVWKTELWGGLLLIAFSIAAGFFFGAFSDNPFALLAICLPLFLMGMLLLFYHSSSRKRD